jgi:hypothetical protein
MGTATAIRLTKPRTSALILEATALAVSLVLGLWLLIWFVSKRAQKSQVEAFFVRFEGAPDAAPFQAADVRRFRNAPEAGAGAVRETRATDLKDAVLQKVGAGSDPLVIYISAPMLGQGADRDKSSEPIRDLIEAVARESRRSAVLLALDLAQVDTDRDLGVYGLSPYPQIVKATEALGQSAAKVLVLTSAAPAQKSWSADGLGQSIFAYYLREGLEGKARRWDAAQPDAITVKGLHAYVRRHVGDWVGDRRHSVQTPMLLPESALAANATPVALRPIARGPSPTDAGAGPAPESSAKEEPSAKAESQGKSEPAATKDAEPGPPDPVKELVAEWKEHDGLRGRKPYRYLPGAWRSYQAALLRAERSLRTARLDLLAADAMARARQDLGAARDKRVELAKRLDQWKAEEEGLAFRSVIGESEGTGKRELDSALAYLTGQGVDAAELIPPPQKAPKPAAEPAKAEDQPAAGPKAAKGPPPILSDVTPDTYLELQLPAWAYRFESRFGKEHFFLHDEPRKATLRELVQARAGAERAIELDRRGLGWIQPVIARGDEFRREVQDELLSGMRQDRARAQWRDRVERVRFFYTLGRRWGDEFRRARATWEEEAAELPALAEWAVRRASFKQGPARPPAEAIPDAAARALKAFNSLAQQLRTRPTGDDGESGGKSADWFRDLKAATDEARTSLDDLRGQFDDAVANLTPRDWTAVDAALRTPLVSAERRETLLSRLPIEEQPVTLQPEPGNAKGPGGQADHSPDPGFWTRATGLAQLDLTLGRIARDLADDGDAPGFKELQAEWQRAQAYSGGGQPDDSARFPDFTTAVHKAALDLKGLDPSFQAGQPRGRKELEPALTELDRLARSLDAWQFDRARTSWIDEAAGRYWRLGRFAALAFHRDRLRKDYADADTLGNLLGMLKEAANAVPVPLEPDPAETTNPPLKPSVKPQEVPLDKWEGALEVALPRPGGGDGSIPPGKAFVGVIVPDGLEIDSPPDAAIPGKLMPVGGQRPAAADDVVGSYRLLQTDFAAGRRYEVRAIAFYRGRADDDTTATAAVSPGPDKDPVTIVIAADKEAWKRKYEGLTIDGIKDQFAEHQDRGFMHLGGTLNYALTFRNQFPRRLDVNCLIELVDPANPQPRKLVDRVLTLEGRGNAGATWTFRNAVALSKDKPDETRVLRVTLTAANRPAAANAPNAQPWTNRLEVTFSQVDVAKYMNIAERFINPCDSPQHDRNQRCYVVYYERRGDDPFTEPIRADRWRCQIVDKRAAGDPQQWIFPGDRALGFHYFPADPAGNYAWSGEIENEEIAGNSGAGWHRKEKKPQ